MRNLNHEESKVTVPTGLPRYSAEGYRQTTAIQTGCLLVKCARTIQIMCSNQVHDANVSNDCLENRRPFNANIVMLDTSRSGVKSESGRNITIQEIHS